MRDRLKSHVDDKSTGDESQSESSDSSDENVEMLPISLKNPLASKKPRASVSAEAFGNWNKKEDFKAPFFPKSAETKEALKKRLEQAFMFSALNPQELDIVLGAMKNCSF